MFTLSVTLPLERAGEHTLLRAAESMKGINTHEALAVVPGEERGSGSSHCGCVALIMFLRQGLTM